MGTEHDLSRYRRMACPAPVCPGVLPAGKPCSFPRLHQVRKCRHRCHCKHRRPRSSMRVFCFKSVSKFVHHQRKLQTPMSSNLFVSSTAYAVRFPFRPRLASRTSSGSELTRAGGSTGPMVRVLCLRVSKCRASSTLWMHTWTVWQATSAVTIRDRPSPWPRSERKQALQLQMGVGIWARNVRLERLLERGYDELNELA